MGNMTVEQYRYNLLRAGKVKPQEKINLTYTPPILTSGEGMKSCWFFEILKNGKPDCECYYSGTFVDAQKRARQICEREYQRIWMKKDHDQPR